MIKFGITLILVVLIFCQGCGPSSVEYDESFRLTDNENGIEVRIIGSNQVFESFDDIDIIAEYEYIGEDDSITIQHSDPYYSFIITDSEGNSEWSTAHNDIGIIEEFRKNHVIRVEFVDLVHGLEPGDYDISFWAQVGQKPQVFSGMEELHAETASIKIRIVGD